MSDATGTVFNLAENAHLFNLDNVITEYGARLLTSTPVFIVGDAGATTTVESKKTPFYTI